MIKEAIRENYKKEILKFIKTKQLQPKKSKIIAEKIENNIFNYIMSLKIQDEQTLESLYLQKAHHLYTNINPQILGNQNFIKKIQNEEIDLDNIVHLKPWVIFPERWAKLTEEQLKEDKICIASAPVANTKQFTCSKCKQNNCSYAEVQTRSADESATLFITCLNPECGHKWRIG